MKVLDLFSGIGGFSLGLHRAGMETVAFCEIEKYPQKVLNKNFPGIPIYDDIRQLTRERLAGDGIGSIDLICGGFPCQPFSQAGHRKGEEDDRHLWPEYFRLIQEIRPRWVIGENVVGIKSLGLKSIVSDLEGGGYSVQCFDISADSIGLPTLERHVWIIASPNRIGQQGVVSQTIPGIPSFSWKFQRSDKRDFSRWAIPSARVCRVGERVPSRVDRLKGLGNAVVPQIPEIIGRYIMEIDRENKNIKP